MLEVSEGGGLARLPEPDAGDLFFDLEGDPFAGDGGLEYLFGWAAVPGDGGDPAYGHTWAHDGPSERAAFEHFIDMVMERREEHPAMHVYHYAPYEPAALKRLMGRYATRAREVDELLRAGAFVDLYQVTRQAVRAGVESYSIKKLERFFGYERRVDLPDVSLPKRRMEVLLQTGQGHEAPGEIREIVRGYNEDDCVSTWRLRQWLEQRRDEWIAAGVEVARPQPREGEPGEELTERQEKLEDLRRRLIEGLSPLPEERDDEEQARWLLAHMLDWHWREEKAAWWEFFRLRDLPEEDMRDEKAAIAGLRWREQLPKVGKERTPRHRYSYPEQLVEIGEGSGAVLRPGRREAGVRSSASTSWPGRWTSSTVETGRRIARSCVFDARRGSREGPAGEPDAPRGLGRGKRSENRRVRELRPRRPRPAARPRSKADGPPGPCATTGSPPSTPPDASPPSSTAEPCRCRDRRAAARPTRGPA